MEEEPSSSHDISGDLLGNVLRPASVRVSRSFRSNRPASPVSQLSPSFRRLHSVRTPRKDEEVSILQPVHWFSRYFNRRLPWVIVIVLWIFLVFKMYSKGPSALESSIAEENQELRQHIPLRNVNQDKKKISGLSVVAREWIWTRYLGRNTGFGSQSDTTALVDRSKKQAPIENSRNNVYAYLKNSSDVNFKRFQALQAGDYFLGKVVGPYNDAEQNLLRVFKSKEESCSSNEGQFAEFARGKRVVILMHELSMTGSPLAMLELAIEIMNCGGKVTVVVLDRRGGLMNELVQRQIPVLTDKTSRSWRAAAKAHLVVAGSAVCAPWIDNYLRYNNKGASRIVWWVMENRREYFDRAKRVLGKVGTVIFLSRIQAEQWKEWSRVENITLPSKLSIVSLSVNDAIASSSGIFSASNSSRAESVKKLREAIRSDMGLQPDDVLFVILSSINPGKGQLIALHAASVVVEERIKHHQRQSMKLLIGSVGSKSNKQDYVEKMLDFLHHHPALESSTFWSPASVSVSGLYAAADVYVMNAQGIGETFGRVTVEAMAFGLPVLGTDAGGTKEIVDANITGLLHPVGMKGVQTFADNIQVLLNNPLLGRQMGETGRRKVKSLYTKEFMYEKLAGVFVNCV